MNRVGIGIDVHRFAPNRKLAFAPGQYMEWTLGHNEPDSRGNRRYFTLASAPTEDELRVGVKFYQNSSTFKQAMLDMDQNSEIVAAQLAGDFVLPHDPQQKCVFIAGGIGIESIRRFPIVRHSVVVGIGHDSHDGARAQETCEVCCVGDNNLIAMPGLNGRVKESFAFELSEMNLA